MFAAAVRVGDFDAGGDARGLGEGAEHGGSGRDGGVDVDIGTGCHVGELEGEVVGGVLFVRGLRHEHHTTK